MNVPQDLKYTDTHEWVRVDGDEATVGITAYAIEQLGDIVFVDLPRPDAEATRIQPFGAVESVKAAADIYAPVTGMIVEVNDSLPQKLDTLKNDPYGQGWLIKIKLNDMAELENLKTAAQYGEMIDTL